MGWSEFGNISLQRPPPTAPGHREAEYDPHLVVARSKIADVWRLEVAHLRTAFLLRVAGLWVLLCVFPAMMQQQQHTCEKEDPWYKEEHNTARVLWLNSDMTCMETLCIWIELNTVYSHNIKWILHQRGGRHFGRPPDSRICRWVTGTWHCSKIRGSRQSIQTR
jgi:hypothetical protein